MGIPILLVSVVLLLNSHVGLCGCYKRIFSFGDSIIDTGNFAYTTGKNPTPVKESPYGMTYFKRSTGRVCDGRVLVDFYAQALGLPLLPPSIPEEGTGQFPTGANFAYLGATALAPAYYKAKFNFDMGGSSHLDLQLDSLKKVLARIAPGDNATKSLLAESLIIMGEIGGNDYNFGLLARNRPRDTPFQYMPDVIGRIGTAVQDVINLGAKTVLVPGNFPIGCVPAYLSAFQSNNTADYDRNGCLVWYNDFSQKHNQLLTKEVQRLSSQNPGVKIIFADYFGGAMQFVQNPKKYGIDDPLVSCCGGDGRYHTGKGCDKNSKVWGNPGSFASWDGIHMTEKAYSVIADGVLNGPFADPALLRTC
ncbi:hypothetical protein PR202_gb05358 [Eleusine coracana subsp. coracana]|uniref:GDSL esterase/lipase n=1 Tax=Eleusine coracana subsp. coracana TaxID=191504 RepID=A0AAV5E704_ELECO|nr:hypothetical protein QOZ80_1BG0076940 [Eleusine coracana subsp. coracana]GJN18218.1 hypothetical protein PR202_gb05358 [Eleusine coracana subsp. coracana]